MSPEEINRENLKRKILDEVLKAFIKVDGFKREGGKIIVKIGRIQPLDKKREVEIAAFLEWKA